MFWKGWLSCVRIILADNIQTAKIRNAKKIFTENTEWKKQFAEIVQCWQTLNKIYANLTLQWVLSWFSLCKNEILDVQYLTARRQNSPFGKYQRHHILLWRIQVSNRKQKTRMCLYDYTESQVNIYQSKLHWKYSGSFPIDCSCSANIAFILDVCCLCIFSLLFPSSHANYANRVKILLVCLSTASMEYFPDLPF